MKFNKYLLVILISFMSLFAISQSGSSCIDSTPFCSGSAMIFPNATSGTAPGGPNYGCLYSQPNPIWYHLQIDQSGTLQLTLSQTGTNWFGQPSSTDIDFAMWGPFTDLETGCGQIMSGNLSPLQCSYSASSTETIGIGLPGGSGSGASTPPNAQAGEYYIILMTNYNGSSGNITLNQTGGTGSTDCSIIKVCDIDAGNDFIVCEGESVTLNATGTSGGNITWNNSIINNQSFTPSLGTTEYIVTNTLSDTVCYDNINITVNPIPIVNAGNDTIICEDETVILNASGADNLIWDNGIINGQSFIPISSGYHTVTGTTLNCSSIDSIYIKIEDKPIINFNADSLYGCIPLLTTFNSNNNGVLKWNFGDGNTSIGNNISHTYSYEGCYTVSLEVTNDFGCSNILISNDYICTKGYPIASFTYSPDDLTLEDNSVNFNNTSIGATDYIWDFGNGTSSSSINPILVLGESPGVYYIQMIASNEYNCSDTASAIIIVKEEVNFYIPNAFTPTTGSINNEFKPAIFGHDPSKYHMVIYNRWGETIFESYDASIGWDGTYNNKYVKSGAYVWQIMFKTLSGKSEDYTGHVVVIR